MPHNIPVVPVLQITEMNNCLTANFRHPYYFRGEFHPFWEMVYAVEDVFQVAGNEKVYTMKKGDIIFHKPMEFHRLWSVEQKDIHAFIVGFCATGSMLRQLEGGAFVLNPQQQAQIEDIMHYVHVEFPRAENHFLMDHLASMARNRDSRAVQFQIFLNRLQLFLLSLAQNTEPLTVKELSDSEDSRIYRQIVQLLTENLNGWITVPEIADRLHCSQSRLNRTFSRFSDVGIHKYLLKLKTAEAIRLLRRGVPCSIISQQLGFGDQNYFSTVFKRETGCRPSQYTQHHP